MLKVLVSIIVQKKNNVFRIFFCIFHVFGYLYCYDAYAWVVVSTPQWLSPPSMFIARALLLVSYNAHEDQCLQH